jgi:hypothetical protein
MKIAIDLVARFALAAFGYAALMPAAHASDGVIEINQAILDASGSHTYTITEPGSYRLTSNLTQFNKDTHVIQILADNVTLDLNGFGISGANHCTWSYGPPSSVSCTGSGLGLGIWAQGKDHVTVKSGFISGMGAQCVALTTNARIIDVSASHCGHTGVQIVSGLVSRVIAVANHLAGIYVGRGSVSDSVSEYNGSMGIILGVGIVRHSYIWRNVSTGVQIAGGSAIGNTIHANEGGLAHYGNVSFSANSMYDNVSDLDGGGVLVNGGGNVCGAAACP